jgi:hypothetical protein
LFEHGLSGRLWPIHCNPYDDETLSSWLSRLSRAYGANPIHFYIQALPHFNVWRRDVDKGTNNDLLLALAAKTSTPYKRVLGTTIRGYLGYLREDLTGRPRSPWLLPVGLRTSTRCQPWLQYCPQCLQADTDPYFRRCWRLAFVTVCAKHKRLLLDRCESCSAVINFQCLPGDAETITQCYHCRHDLRLAQAPPIGESVEYDHLAQFQTFLLSAMRRGQGRLWGVSAIQGAPFLKDVYKCMMFFLSIIHAPAFREAFGEYLLPSFFDSHLTLTRQRSLERLGVEDRQAFMVFISWWYNRQFQRWIMPDSEIEFRQPDRTC